MSENLESNNQSAIHCKTILVGDSGVGKTSIIGRYVKKFNSNEKATIGASFTNKTEEIDGKQIIFEIWDTAGQERFRSINTIFYQDAYICIMVYDITNKKSFDDLKEYWYNAVKEGGSEGIIFHIAGNKIDLFENEKVQNEEVKDFCDSIECEYSFISAMQNTYIDDLFKKLGQKFIKSDIYKNLVQTKNKKKIERISLKPDEEKEGSEKKKKKKRWCFI